MHQISVIGDARVCPDELARQLVGLFQIEFQLLHEALDAKPKRHTLIDIGLHDGPQLVLLKDWLKGKPQNADVIFATDRASRPFCLARGVALGLASELCGCERMR